MKTWGLESLYVRLLIPTDLIPTNASHLFQYRLSTDPGKPRKVSYKDILLPSPMPCAGLPDPPPQGLELYSGIRKPVDQVNIVTYSFPCFVYP